MGFVAAGFALVGAACPETETDDGVPTPRSCHLVFDFAKACSECIEAHCCEEAGACAIDFECRRCVEPADVLDCAAGAPPPAVALGDCIEASCLDDCLPPFAEEVGDPDCDAPAIARSMGACMDEGYECNPVTNAGCEEGESCGALNGGFTCYPLANVRDLCEPCGYAGDYCRLGMMCIGHCARNCCNDLDCGENGRCDTTFWFNGFQGDPPAGLGVCVEIGN